MMISRGTYNPRLKCDAPCGWANAPMYSVPLAWSRQPVCGMYAVQRGGLEGQTRQDNLRMRSTRREQRVQLNGTVRKSAAIGAFASGESKSQRGKSKQAAKEYRKQ